jgi:hypothetical protein
MPVFVEVNGFLLAVKSVSSEDVASRFSQPNPLGIADPEKWAVVITLGAS